MYVNLSLTGLSGIYRIYLYRFSNKSLNMGLLKSLKEKNLRKEIMEKSPNWLICFPMLKNVWFTLENSPSRDIWNVETNKRYSF